MRRGKPKAKDDRKGRPPRKRRWTPDPDGQLGVAKSIAARFGEEIVEEEFYAEPQAVPAEPDA